MIKEMRNSECGVRNRKTVSGLAIASLFVVFHSEFRIPNSALVSDG